ncbi:MAG: DUF2252 family protein [Bacteriovorax sp.]|nr:DUF2252 family protein [Bacteriovorax sp.]
MRKLTVQYLLFAILFGITSISVFATEEIETTLTDINYQFDKTKVNASEDSFHFLRSFVDYYYKLIPVNADSLNVGRAASHFSGWCVGDAHPENFGALLQDNSTVIFGMNDMDDSGPCPVVYDFLRLLVSTRLYQPKFNILAAIDFYEHGMNLESVKVPSNIQSLLNAGLKAGPIVNPKDLEGNIFKRKKESVEVASEVRFLIEKDLKELFSSDKFISENIRVIDILATSKIGGGSAGLLRYEVLCSLENGEKIHLELKELTTPAIESIATTAIPDQKSRMLKSLLVEQGEKASHYYSVLGVNGKTMLLRPKFMGNLGIVLDENLVSENSADIINYEAYTLGRIHSQTTDVSEYRKALSQLKPNEWENDVTAFTKQFNKKYSQLKN